MEERSDRFTAIEDLYADYTVYDTDGDKIGKVDDLLVDENDQSEYLATRVPRGKDGLARHQLYPDTVADGRSTRGR